MATVNCKLLFTYAQERACDPQSRHIIQEATAVLRDLGHLENAALLEHHSGLWEATGEQAPGSPAAGGSAMGAPGAGTTASTSAQPGSPTQSVWQWLDPDSSWETFDSCTQLEMEQAYDTGKPCFFCKIDDEDFCVDFVSWEHTGLRSGSARRIRRAPALTGAETVLLLGLQGGTSSAATSPIHSPPLNYCPSGPPTPSGCSSSNTPSGGNDSPQAGVQMFMFHLQAQQWQQHYHQLQLLHHQLLVLLFPPLPLPALGGAAAQPAPALPQPQLPAAPPPPPLQPQPAPLQPQPPPLQPQPPPQQPQPPPLQPLPAPQQPQPLQPPPPPALPVPQEMDHAPGQDAGPAAAEEAQVPPQAEEDDGDASSESPVFLYPLLYPPNFSDLEEPLLSGSQEAAAPREGGPDGRRERATRRVEHPPGPRCCWDLLADPCGYICCRGCGCCTPEEEEG